MVSTLCAKVKLGVGLTHSFDCDVSKCRRTGYISYDDVVDDSCAEDIGNCDDEYN